MTASGVNLTSASANRITSREPLPRPPDKLHSSALSRQGNSLDGNLIPGKADNRSTHSRQPPGYCNGLRKRTRDPDPTSAPPSTRSQDPRHLGKESTPRDPRGGASRDHSVDQGSGKEAKEGSTPSPPPPQPRPQGTLTQSQQAAPVGGRLQLFQVEWLQLSSSAWVKQAVSGLKLQLTDRPPLTSASNSFDSARGCGAHKRELIHKEVMSLREKQAIERAPSSPGFYGRLFLVPKKTGGFRPVFNLRPLNHFIQKESFKMATIRTVAAAIRPGDFAVSLDLKDAYLHIPIHKLHRKFLRFTFKGTSYQFKVLPFGLSSAPRVFTKLTRVVVLYCRRLAMRVILYLDDSLLLARPRQVALQHRDILLELLQRLGWVVNWAKSDLAPTQSWEFIGLQWSSRDMTVSLPQDKLQVIHSSADTMLQLPAHPTCRRVQRFLGRTNFAATAVPRAKLQVRALQRDLANAYKSSRDLFRPCPLSPAAQEELRWWLLPPVTSVPLVPAQPTVTVASDASKSGWGAQWGAKQLAGIWSREEADQHINLLEMRAVLLALKEWAPLLRGKVIAWYADNKTVVAYLLKEGGTRSWSLCLLTKEVFRILDRWAITIRPAYLKGIANAGADALSRGRAVKEWCLDPRVSTRLFRRRGAPQWDLFADGENHLAPLYFSLDRTDKRAQGIDAFMQEWGTLQGRIYAFPPPQLIPQVLSRIVTARMELLLVAPCWEDAAWLPEILSLCIREPLKLPHWAVIEGPKGKPPPKSRELHMVAWTVSGAESSQQGPHGRWHPSWLPHSGDHPAKPMREHGSPGQHGAAPEVWTQLRQL